MNTKSKTLKQIQKEIEANNKANEKLLKEANQLAQAGINEQIKDVDETLSTLLEDDNFDMTDLKKKFKALLQKSYGKGYVVKVAKKPTVGKFHWAVLADKMAKNGAAGKQNAKSRKELEELFYSEGNKVFGQPFNDKEERSKYLKATGTAANMKYYV